MRKFILTLMMTGLSTGSAAQAALEPAEAQLIIRKIESLYAPLASEQSGHLKIEIDANDTSATASAHREPADEFKVVLASGYLNQANLTADILRFTICHELGHLFGGHPHRPAPMEWTGPTDENGDMLLSAEAQSDYYANLKCMRLILADEDNVAALPSLNVDPLVQQRCELTQSDRQASALCQRASMAGYGMLRVVYPFKIAFHTPATEVAPKTIRDTYPSRQCRLDTIFAGAVCADEASSACSALATPPTPLRPPGARPACWYRADE